MHPTSRPSCRMARSIDSPSPSTQKRRLFSRSALGMTGMQDSTSIYAPLVSGQRYSSERAPNPGTVIVHAPLPGIVGSIVDKRSMEAIRVRVAEQEGYRVTGY